MHPFLLYGQSAIWYNFIAERTYPFYIYYTKPSAWLF
jgi:hypothetical protein